MTDNEISYQIRGAVFGKQILTYLRLMNLHLGLLINFNTSDLRGSIQRIVN